MNEFKLYARIADAWQVVAEYEGAQAFYAAINGYFDMKKAEGKVFDDCDTVLGLLLVPTVILRKKFGLVKRALRHFDEIGICSELVDAIDQAKDEGADAVGWGQEDMASVTAYDFGDMLI